MPVAEPSEHRLSNKYDHIGLQLIADAEANPGQWVYSEQAEPKERQSTALRNAMGRLWFRRSFEIKTRGHVVYMRTR